MGVFFFFNDTATTEIYTLSLHDALPISNPQNTPCMADAAIAAAEGIVPGSRMLNTAPVMLMAMPINTR